MLAYITQTQSACLQLAFSLAAISCDLAAVSCDLAAISCDLTVSREYDNSYTIASIAFIIYLLFITSCSLLLSCILHHIAHTFLPSTTRLLNPIYYSLFTIFFTLSANVISCVIKIKWIYSNCIVRLKLTVCRT